MFAFETISPYGFCKIVNEMLQLTLPPQMFYQYVAKGKSSTSASMLQSVVVNNKRVITAAEAERWILQYAERNKLELKIASNQLELF